MKMLALLSTAVFMIHPHAEEYLAYSAPSPGSFASNVEKADEVAFSKPSDQETSTATTSRNNRIFIERARGLLILGSPADVVNTCLKGVRGIQVVGVNIPGGLGPFSKALDPIYLDQKIGQEKVTQLKRAIAKYYKQHGRPVVTVQVPEQDVTDGVLQLIVIEGRVGKITVDGNKWFKSERLQNYLSLKPNEEIDEDQLMEDIVFINRNPFRRADVIYAPGEEPGQTDIRLMTTDHHPIRLYAGGENTGVYATGHHRWIGGAIWANAWGLDHILGFQYSSSADFSKFQAYTGNYEVPLPWKHVALFYGGYSKIHATVTGFPHLTNNGNSAQASGRYKYPMRHHSGWVGEFYFGLDWKRTNNTIEFGGLGPPIIAQNANLFQIMGGYAGSIETCIFKMSMDFELYGSPFKFLPNQSDAVYSNLVPGAKVFYAYGRTSWAFMFRLPRDFSFSILTRGQLSSINLLPTEQYGIGGYSTVRGYEERQLNYEQAVLASGELRSPAIGIIKRYKTKINDGLQFLGFFDWGWGGHHTDIPGATNSDYLMGIGAGARYAIQEWFNARLDWGYQLRQSSNFIDGPNMIHFAVIGSY